MPTSEVEARIFCYIAENLNISPTNLLLGYHAGTLFGLMPAESDALDYIIASNRTRLPKLTNLLWCLVATRVPNTKSSMQIDGVWVSHEQSKSVIAMATMIAKCFRGSVYTEESNLGVIVWLSDRG
jgi:hypothetical protein